MRPRTVETDPERTSDPDTGPTGRAVSTRRGLAGEEIPVGEDRILTIPNVITLVRFLCIPLFVWLLFARDDRFGAALLLAFMGATDWVDGYIARHFDQVSNLGKMMDPAVDRLLMIAGIGGTIIVGLDSTWFRVFALVVVVREVTLSIFVASIVLMGAKRMDVTKVGKWGMFGMLVAFPSFLASFDERFAGTAVETGFLVLAWAAGIPGLVCSLIAYVGYLRNGVVALREGRAAHEEALVREAALGGGPRD